MTPAEFCMDHIKLDKYYKYWLTKKNNSAADDTVKRNYSSNFSKYYVWDMESYFGCRYSYEQDCRKFGEARVRSYSTDEEKKQLDCSSVK